MAVSNYFLLFAFLLFSKSSNALLVQNTEHVSNGQDLADLSRQIRLLQEDNLLVRKQLASNEAKLENLQQHSSNVETSLQTKIQALQNEQDTLARKHQNVAFFAYLTRSITNPSSGTTIVFDDVLTGDGSSSYDRRHGIFRAPVNGTYHFALTATVPSNTEYHAAHIYITKNGQKMSYLFLDLRLPNWQQGTVTSLLHLATNDKIWVELQVGGNFTIAGLSGGNKHTYFSGFLINAD